MRKDILLKAMGEIVLHIEENDTQHFYLTEEVFYYTEAHCTVL